MNPFDPYPEEFARFQADQRRSRMQQAHEFIRLDLLR